LKSAALEINMDDDMGLDANTEGGPVPSTGKRDPRFPPMVRVSVFKEALSQLAGASPDQREELLVELGDNDRSQLRRTLTLFGVLSEDDRYDEIALRRLADPERGPDALRDLLQRHYGPELRAIAEGVDTRQLEQLLAVESRSSQSSLEKARQFFLWAAAEAGFSTAGIRQAARRPAETAVRRPRPGVGIRRDEVAGTQDVRFVEQQQDFLDQLLARHATAEGQEAERLETLIEQVSARIERRLIARLSGT
jgi:hypothetical protein